MKLQAQITKASNDDLEPSGVATVVATLAIIPRDSLQLVYRTDGVLRALSRIDEASLTVTRTTQWRPFDAFQLAAEVKPIEHEPGLLFDPMMAVRTSNVDPTPYQITAVYVAASNEQPRGNRETQKEKRPASLRRRASGRRCYHRRGWFSACFRRVPVSRPFPPGRRRIPMTGRVITYIDGFNLYFGLRSKGWRKYYWLDLVAVSTALLKTGQTLAGTHYFTSRIRATQGNADDVKRQSVYLDALEAHGGVLRHEGHYLAKPQRCRSCGAQWQTYEEKMTDVRIATRLLGDAIDDQFDTAIIISGDSDLTPPVQEVLARFPTKRIVVAFPPDRHSDQLRKAATSAFTLGEAHLRQSQLPDVVTTVTGFKLTRPVYWK
ncbi:MAG: NYN domain-containing protein [Myxococcales bacterium]